jgi:predicted transcriptional regulator
MPDPSRRLSKRERQIMEIVYARGGQATANDVMADLPDPPTRTTIRTLLRILEGKGHLTHSVDAREFVYKPTQPRTQAGRSALRSVLHAFFGNSASKALAAHLADPKTRLTAVEAAELKALIEQAKNRGES